MIKDYKNTGITKNNYQTISSNMPTYANNISQSWRNKCSVWATYTWQLKLARDDGTDEEYDDLGMVNYLRTTPHFHDDKAPCVHRISWACGCCPSPNSSLAVLSRILSHMFSQVWAKNQVWAKAILIKPS